MSSRHENGERSRLLSNSGSFHSSYDAVEDISEKRNALDITSSIQSQFDSFGTETPTRKRFGDIFPLNDPGLAHKVISSGYESLDYDVPENDIYLREERDKTHKTHLKVSFLRWVVIFLIGALTACVAASIDIVIKYVADYKYSLIFVNINDCVVESCIARPIGIWLGFGIILVLGATLLVVFVEPVAAGSGIPEIKCYLNGVKIPHVVRLQTLVAKAVGVVGSVAGGLPVGKEGPMIHSGAVVAAGISQGRSETLRTDFKIFQSFRLDHEKRDFVSAGAAAGVAAAFGAPIGGVLFALEEGASFWSQSLTWRIFFCSMTSSFVLNLILSGVQGEIGQLSNPGLINFGVFSGNAYVGYELPIFAFMGVIGGLLGAGFNYINFKLSVFRRRYVRSNFFKIMEPILIVLCVIISGILLSVIIMDCHPEGYVPTIRPVQMFCKDGEYNAIAGLFFATPEEAIRLLFHAQEGSFGLLTVFFFFFVFFLLTCWTYGVSVPSGLFVPCILSGAAFGRLFGVIMHTLFPHLTLSPSGRYALIGSAAILGGVLRMTISLTVIMIEATQNVAYGLPIMVVIIIAKSVGDLFNEGIYDIHIELKSVPLLAWEPVNQSVRYEAKEIMTSPVHCLNVKEKVRVLVAVLKRTKHNGFAVVEKSSIVNSANSSSFGLFRGIILRSQLIILLRNKAFENSGSMESDDRMCQLGSATFQHMYPRYPSIHTVSVTRAEEELYVDLRPFMNPGAYTAYIGSTYPHIFKLFRGLGLRHLAIVDEHNQVVGMVTRQDLARYRLGHGQNGMLYKLPILNETLS
ncbi:H(+)/Cl(-) exchange transporter 7-like [Oscarella lobularis]|uniref:H(+)/Cl(-) exchange transporter 7-like n=1 Tax=Oscarella lobularis TaxID=121494 RepID=UPI0033133789